jgi:hypothetical protein
MPADGMSAAAKINRKNKRTSASPDWQLAKRSYFIGLCAAMRRWPNVKPADLGGSPPALEHGQDEAT